MYVDISAEVTYIAMMLVSCIHPMAETYDFEFSCFVQSTLFSL